MTSTILRGFADWKPYKTSQKLLADVQTVLAEYEAYLPMTVRQVFYRLVGAYDYPKTSQFYANLSGMLGRARRAQVIPMESIRDDGITESTPDSWTGVEQFTATMESWAEDFRLDRSEDQETNLIVACEAAGMVPMLADAVKDFGIKVTSCGGYDSITAKHALGKELGEDGRDAEILHIGDYDHDGRQIFQVFAEDVAAFAEHYGGDVITTRLAVTPEQIESLNLASDFESDKIQAEAIPPDELARIVREAVENRFDMKAYKRTLARERREREELIDKVRNL